MTDLAINLDSANARMLAERPGGGELSLFLPTVDGSVPERELRCRAALASTFVAGLELAREGAVRVEQQRAWQHMLLSDATLADAVPREGDQRSGPATGQP